VPVEHKLQVPRCALQHRVLHPEGACWYSEWGTLRNTNNAIFLATLMGKNGATATSRQQHMLLGTQVWKYCQKC